MTADERNRFESAAERYYAAYAEWRVLVREMARAEAGRLGLVSVDIPASSVTEPGDWREPCNCDACRHGDGH